VPSENVPTQRHWAIAKTGGGMPLVTIQFGKANKLSVDFVQKLLDLVCRTVAHGTDLRTILISRPIHEVVATFGFEA
jgi:hypothetical protein